MENIEQLISPQRGGWTATVGYDPVTGEATEPMVAEGHSPYSPFADNNFTLNEPDLTPEEQGPGEESEGDQMIIDGLLELYPDLDDIIDHVVDNYSKDILDIYDEAVDSGDWAKVNEFLEQWSSEFRELQPQDTTPSEQEINEGLDDLSSMEPEGLEVAYEYLQMAENSSDPVEQEVLYQTSLFHKGDVNAQESIQAMLNKYSIEQLIPIYNKYNL